MDSWEWNKIAGAVCGTVLFVLVVKLVADHVYDSPAPKKPGYAVQVPEESASQTVAAAPETERLPDFAAILPVADLAHGKELEARCQQCHDNSNAGANKIGPNLWGVVGRARASYPGYSYSSAMSASREPWSFAALYLFLRAPGASIPGTKMSFAGLRSADDRIDLIAYLNTQSSSPLPVSDQK